MEGRIIEVLLYTHTPSECNTMLVARKDLSAGQGPNPSTNNYGAKDNMTRYRGILPIQVRGNTPKPYSDYLCRWKANHSL